MKSLLLTSDWDLTVDSSGNIATCEGYAALAQDVACACRLFLGELWYNTKDGIPYDTKILNKYPPKPLVIAQLEAAAKSVPGVILAKVQNLEIINRLLTGTIKVTDAAGISRGVTF